MSFRFNFVGRALQVLSEDKTCEGDESVGGWWRYALWIWLCRPSASSFVCGQNLREGADGRVMLYRFNFVGRPPQVLSEDKTCEWAVCAGRMVELCCLDLILSAVRFKFCLWANLATGQGAGRQAPGIIQKPILSARLVTDTIPLKHFRLQVMKTALQSDIRRADRRMGWGSSCFRF